MSVGVDQVKRIAGAVERGAIALERIAAALEVANHTRAFPPSSYPYVATYSVPVAQGLTTDVFPTTSGGSVG